MLSTEGTFLTLSTFIMYVVARDMGMVISIKVIKSIWEPLYVALIRALEHENKKGNLCQEISTIWRVWCLSISMKANNT